MTKEEQKYWDMIKMFGCLFVVFLFSYATYTVITCEPKWFGW